MTFSKLREATLCFSTAALLIVAGCGGQGEQGPMVPADPGASAGGPGGPGGGPPPASNPKLKEAMVRLARGPSSLTPTIGKALAAEKLDWAALEPQAKEFVKLVGEMAKEEPPKGSKESWAKQVGTYLASAQNLEKAVVAKNLEDAKAAHGELAGSCMACHREHRATGGGPGGGFRGGMGGGMGGGGFRGGPGGPGGPPPAEKGEEPKKEGE